MDLEDISAQILILDHIGKVLVDIVGGYLDPLALHFARIETKIVEKLLHDGVQPSCTDVLRRGVHFVCDLADTLDGLVREDDIDTFGLQQFTVLERDCVLGFLEDAVEVLCLEIIQLNSQRETSLKLGDEVARLGNVECASGDEEDVGSSNFFPTGTMEKSGFFFPLGRPKWLMTTRDVPGCSRM